MTESAARVPRVLVVEDDPEMLRALALNLTARGFAVTTASDGTAALNETAAASPDVIVLDLGLPDLDGMDIIRAIRGYTRTPIVVLSGRTGSGDKVDALDAGADDYVTKPFDVNELVARLRAATRRAAPGDSEALVRIGTTTVNLEAKTIERQGADGTAERIALTPTEWLLLEALVTHPGRLVSQSALLARMRGGQEGYTDSSYLRIYIAQLRKKLEPEPSHPRHFLTEPGMGYRFQP
ncbi:MAG TPA: response regulator transcription factor [Frankiaceae bacterium]|nr:response regulator transcription factor [Frankiaceae bacterium]